MDLAGLDHIALAVSDVERSARWYVDVLGFERRFEGMWDGVPVFVGKGATAVALFPMRKPAEGASDKSNPRMLHFALRTTRDGFTAAQIELKARGITYQFEDHEISHSIYFRDPDETQIEITTYEL